MIEGQPERQDQRSAVHPTVSFALASTAPISSEFSIPKACPSPPSSSVAVVPRPPPGYQARDWEHGVFVGSIMASETTAASPAQLVLSAATHGHVALLRLPWAFPALRWAKSGRQGSKIFNVTGSARRRQLHWPDSATTCGTGLSSGCRILDAVETHRLRAQARGHQHRGLESVTLIPSGTSGCGQDLWLRCGRHQGVLRQVWRKAAREPSTDGSSGKAPELTVTKIKVVSAVPIPLLYGILKTLQNYHPRRLY